MTTDRESASTSTNNAYNFFSTNNYYLVKAFAQMLRMILNFSAQETTVNLERLQHNLCRLIRFPRISGRPSIRCFFLFRRSFTLSEENNTLCLSNVYRLRVSLRMYIAMLSNQAQNTRVHSCLSALNDEVQALNTLEGQLINTNFRIRTLLDEVENQYRFRRQVTSTNQYPNSMTARESSSTQSQTQDQSRVNGNEESGNTTNSTNPIGRSGRRRPLETDDNVDDQPPTSRRRLLNIFDTREENNSLGNYTFYMANH